MSFQKGEYIIIKRFAIEPGYFYPRDLKASTFIFKQESSEYAGHIVVQNLHSKQEFTFEIGKDIISLDQYLHEIQINDRVELQHEITKYFEEASIETEGLDNLWEGPSVEYPPQQLA